MKNRVTIETFAVGVGFVELFNALEPEDAGKLMRAGGALQKLGEAVAALFAPPASPPPPPPPTREGGGPEPDAEPPPGKTPAPPGHQAGPALTLEALTEAVRRNPYSYVHEMAAEAGWSKAVIRALVKANPDRFAPLQRQGWQKLRLLETPTPSDSPAGPEATG